VESAGKVEISFAAFQLVGNTPALIGQSVLTLELTTLVVNYNPFKRRYMPIFRVAAHAGQGKSNDRVTTV